MLHPTSNDLLLALFQKGIGHAVIPIWHSALSGSSISKSLSVKRTLLFTVLILAISQVEAKVIFVTVGGAGNGTSWATAMGGLHRALEMAQAGDQIWVSKGTYRTADNNDRSRSFVLKAGVALYGGFAGFETSIDQRNLLDNITYLSGEIGTSSLQDNAFTVVFCINVGDKAVVDGFYITGGAANGSDEAQHLEFRGAGMINLATDGQSSSPSIRNCTITRNYAREGAGMLNLAMKKGACEPAISHCSFINNKADLDGGAIMNISIDGNCSPEITDCLFEVNVASYGAGIFNEPRGGSVSPVIRSNIFKNNKAMVRSGSIHNEYSSDGSCQPVIGSNYFEGNTASVGQEKNSSATQKAKDDNPAGYK